MFSTDAVEQLLRGEVKGVALPGIVSRQEGDAPGLSVGFASPYRQKGVRLRGRAVVPFSSVSLIRDPYQVITDARCTAVPNLPVFDVLDEAWALASAAVELAAPYLKENAQIIDPFCGVGTMLIERDIRVPAREKYGTDIFGEAIDGARENAALAGEQINFIHRDFFDFRHDYLFDEIVTNMPVRGKMTREQLDSLYEKFFRKALTILEKEAVIVMYTGEIGFVKKQLRLHREFSLLEEYCMQSKAGCYLLIIGVKR